MARTQQPLLDTPKNSHRKTLYVVLFLTAIIGLTTLPVIFQYFTKLSSSNPRLLQNICNHAQNQASCLALVTEIATTTTKKLDHANLLQVLLKKSAPHIQNTIEKANDVSRRINDPREQSALVDCVDLMEISLDRIKDSREAISRITVDNSHANAHAWLSSVLTNHVTCLDGLIGQARFTMKPKVHDLILQARASLAIIVAISPIQEDMIQPLKGDFPLWVTRRDRKLLQAFPKDIMADVIVAKDGSGKYKTLQEAVASVPKNGKDRYVIYVKKGTYKENVEVGKAKKNVMIVGDGMDSTIITASLNKVDINSTYRSATVAAVGDGFMAQDIWFQNTAGPKKYQAVALRVNADKSVINRCRIDGYQDTLYVHSLRQFYKDCYITGTVDFIFGNAAVVLQNCTIVARKPMSGQNNMVTAQGRTDPNENTAISIQNCNIIASSDLEPVKGSSVKSYLGRPWKQYSRTVVMESNIGDHIDPAGWSPWSGDFALKTLYYGEFMNKGPGAGTRKRVNWPGFHVITSSNEARKFTVAELIQGGSWLQPTGVAYTEGL